VSESRRYIPSTKLPNKASSVALDTEADFTFMLASTMQILQREIANLNFESGKGKLSKDSATVLISYVKLLNELADKETKLIEAMNETELQSHTAGIKETK
jgi:ATP-dependent Clp protease ATP-binding subunit ClpA